MATAVIYIQLVILALFTILCCINVPEDDPKLLFLMVFIPLVFLTMIFMI